MQSQVAYHCHRALPCDAQTEYLSESAKPYNQSPSRRMLIHIHAYTFKNSQFWTFAETINDDSWALILCS